MPADPGCGSAAVDMGPAGAAWWDARYLAGDSPWDTGIVPPEVVALVASGLLMPGWALDLGCGSGVSSCYLAQHGFSVVGVDLAQSALVRARRSAAAGSLPILFCRGDASELSFLSIRAAFALDIGCFHTLPGERRPVYVASLAGRLAPGAAFLLYAFEPHLSAGDDLPRGVGPASIAQFAPSFTLRWSQHGRDGDRPSAWYLFQRTG